jgi:hypothetical protein
MKSLLIAMFAMSFCYCEAQTCLDISRQLEELKKVNIESAKGKAVVLPIKENLKMELVWVPAGYWVGKYPVTQAQFKAVMGWNPSCFKGDQNPVDSVNWYDATFFCQHATTNALLLGLPENWVVVLPTEKQWEDFSVGDTNMFGAPALDEKQIGTQSVGLTKPNNLGLYDLHGHINQWCQDWYDGRRRERVLRGGAWSDKLSNIAPYDPPRYSPPPPYGDNPLDLFRNPPTSEERDKQVKDSSKAYDENLNRYDEMYQKQNQEKITKTRIDYRHHYRPESKVNGVGFRVVLIESKSVVIDK